MNRLLSRREKDGGGHKRDKSREKAADKKNRSSAEAVLKLFRTVSENKPEIEYSNKVHALRQKLQQTQYIEIEEEHINYALASKYADGDVDRAFEIILLFQESVQGVIHPYNPEIQMLGSENREGVTCYLDSLLFAMFARLGSFEPILYTKFEDEPRRRLSSLIRLWVNMLRTGKLIQTDVTRILQEALAACGWEEAAMIQQQDTSEAFRFIAETLDLPLLTMKVDIFHHAAEDDKDDHKFVNERLLCVAVEDREDGREQRLENCLEEYFNNKIEVTRLQRSNTVLSAKSGPAPDTEKVEAIHVEVAEMSTPNTPISMPPTSPLIPNLRHRAASVIRNRIIEGQDPEKNNQLTNLEGTMNSEGDQKTASRKEVIIPAWQFFNLIPWYTNQDSLTNASDVGVAASFSRTRPLLGICLKRYGMKDGKPFRKNTPIDIPLEMRLPHFIDDGGAPDDSARIGDFKLVLQSVICHRGQSVYKGHYISLVRGRSLVSDGDSQSSRRQSDTSQPPDYPEDLWYKFDDIATPRVRTVTFEEGMKGEMAYLLYYQIAPIIATATSSLNIVRQPPEYKDSRVTITETSSENTSLAQQQGYFDGTKLDTQPVPRLSIEVERQPISRTSLNLPDERRMSVAHTEHTSASTASSVVATSAPVTPSEETTAQRMSRAAARFTKVTNRSRPTSQSGENRLSSTFSKLTLGRSKEQLSKMEASKEKLSPGPAAVEPRKSITIDETPAVSGDQLLNRSKSKKEKKRPKSKTRGEKTDAEHVQSKRKAKGKAGDAPDRECTVM